MTKLNIVISTVLFLFNGLNGQTSLLSNYNFEEGGYALVAYHKPHFISNKLADSLHHWYTRDINVLNKIKSEWISNKLEEESFCDYQYEIYLCKDGIKIEQFLLGLDCKQICGDEGVFVFQTEKLVKFKHILNKARVNTKQYINLQSARKDWENIKRNNDVIFVDEPDWLNYEGTFNFSYRIPGEYLIHCSTLLSMSQEYDKCEKIISKLKNQFKSELRNKYPDEPFQLEIVAFHFVKNKISVEVTCNKSLADKYDIYESEAWEPFELELMTFWKK